MGHMITGSLNATGGSSRKKFESEVYGTPWCDLFWESSEWVMCKKPTVNNATKYYGRDTEFSGQSSVEYQPFEGILSWDYSDVPMDSLTCPQSHLEE